MPTTIRLTEPHLPVFMTIGADDAYRITEDHTHELRYTLELLRAWQFSDALSNITRSHALGGLMAACAEHNQGLHHEATLGPIHPYAVQLAIYFISALPKELPDPECGVDRDGEVNLEWFGAKGHLLTLSINGTGRIAYAYLHGDQHERGALRMQDHLPKRLLELISHFN